MITIYPQNQIRKFLKGVQSKDEYKSFLEGFKRRGSETVKYEQEGVVIHIYVPELAYVLTLNEKIQTDNYDNGSKEMLNTSEFLGYFFDGFCKGLKDFEEDFKLNPDTKYGGDISDYLEDIKYHCFDANVMGHKQGWGFVRFRFPLIFKKEQIFKYGYYSGLVRSVDELIEKNPSRFRELDSAKRNFLNCFQDFDRNILATGVRAVRAIKSPAFLKDEKDIYAEVTEIENLMFDDSKTLTSIEDFKTKTQHVFTQTKPDIHSQLFEYLLNRATDHLNIKKEQKNLGTGTYIDRDSKQIGKTTINSEWKKTPKENIGIKVNTLESYLQWLNENYKELKTLQPQQENKKSEVNENLYNEYFRGNTFLLFKEYCESNSINATCRTHLRLLFELFKKEGYFVDTIELKQYLKFLNSYLNYENSELKIVNLDSNPSIKKTNDFNRIKNNLKLTLK